MQDFFKARSLDEVLADLRASYQRFPGLALAEMIRRVEAEIAYRDAARARETESHETSRALPAA